MNAKTTPPLPKDPADVQRVEHSRLRRRVIYGQHEADIKLRLRKMIGTVREQAWPPVNMTAGVATHVYGQLAGLYREAPEVTPPPGGEIAAAALSDAGHWSLMQRVQRDTIGMNDLLVAVSIVDGEPVTRMAWADMVDVDVDPRVPSRPIAVREDVFDPVGDRWVKIETDPAKRIHRAIDENGQDVSVDILGGSFSGDAYPFLIDGEPVLNYVAYHAAETGYVFDPYSGREVIEGALDLGAYFTNFSHVMSSASWAQRWAYNAEPAGGSTDETGNRREIVTDPATLFMLRPSEDGAGQGSAGQWAAPVDPTEFLSAIERYERRIVEMALGTVGVSRRESDVRSAASLAVSREAQMAAQRAYEPLFRRSDLQLLRLVAGLMGAPTKGWRIQYKSLPRDPQELAAEQKRMLEQIDAGLLDKVTAYQALHPGLTRDEAAEAVALIAETNRRFT